MGQVDFRLALALWQVMFKKNVEPLWRVVKHTFIHPFTFNGNSFVSVILMSDKLLY